MCTDIRFLSYARGMRIPRNFFILLPAVTYPSESPLLALFLLLCVLEQFLAIYVSLCRYLVDEGLLCKDNAILECMEW